MTYAMVLDLFLVTPPLTMLVVLAVVLRIAAQRINDDRPLRHREERRRVEQLAHSQFENPSSPQLSPGGSSRPA
jgi:hypothetical protein